ncbi:MAG: SRPBCC domain-containing protein [Actinomycetota bacterium]|nr:SRPBCC domain-containing protein [Actinomycetota bacterium]
MVVDGEVIEADPPHKLVQTWRMLMMGPTQAPEGFTRLTWEIEEIQSGVTKLTVVHDLEGAPQTAVMVAGGMEADGAGGGWNEILSGLKTLLETGEVLRG